MFDISTANVEEVDIDLEASLKPVTHGQTGAQDRAPPFHRVSGWAGAGIQGAKKGGKKELAVTKTVLQCWAYLNASRPRMERSSEAAPLIVT